LRLSASSLARATAWLDALGEPGAPDCLSPRLRLLVDDVRSEWAGSAHRPVRQGVRRERAPGGSGTATGDGARHRADQRDGAGRGGGRWPDSRPVARQPDRSNGLPGRCDFEARAARISILAGSPLRSRIRSRRLLTPDASTQLADGAGHTSALVSNGGSPCHAPSPCVPTSTRPTSAAWRGAARTGQARRLLALAAIHDGGTRSDGRGCCAGRRGPGLRRRRGHPLRLGECGTLRRRTPSGRSSQRGSRAKSRVSMGTSGRETVRWHVKV
jgi:hypothetical protein